jgi:hypothetical protein
MFDNEPTSVSLFDTLKVAMHPAQAVLQRTSASTGIEV